MLSNLCWLWGVCVCICVCVVVGGCSATWLGYRMDLSILVILECLEISEHSFCLRKITVWWIKPFWSETLQIFDLGFAMNTFVVWLWASSLASLNLGFLVIETKEVTPTLKGEVYKTHAGVAGKFTKMIFKWCCSPFIFSFLLSSN